jgi:hypothetical protein
MSDQEKERLEGQGDGSHYVAKAGLKLTVLLPQSPSAEIIGIGHLETFRGKLELGVRESQMTAACEELPTPPPCTHTTACSSGT